MNFSKIHYLWKVSMCLGSECQNCLQLLIAFSHSLPFQVFYLTQHHVVWWLWGYSASDINQDKGKLVG